MSAGSQSDFTAQTTAENVPRIARAKPFYHELEPGRAYVWCACGLSASQPFCDGSHRGTGIEPVRYRCGGEAEEVLFCGCKRTGDAPFCDGTHNNLLGGYEEDDPQSAENRAIALVARSADGKARLDGGCFVAHIDDLECTSIGGLRVSRVICAHDGAIWQSHFRIKAPAGTSPVLGFGDRHTLFLITSGAGVIQIGGRSFEVAPEMGIYARPGEPWRTQSAQGLTMNAAVSPLADWPELVGGDPCSFDPRFPERRAVIDPARRNAMGERFFQILVDASVGSDLATQFIGEVPLSKAAPHRHLYEESLIVLRGHGMMWTETCKAEVGTGDVIFLPRKQSHSLQCTDPGGMMLAGVIYPGNNPSISY
ncbi:MAG: CDGSH iron-sulfur domain-containing protein [Gammaproteobacteria bacterium]